MSNQLFPAEKPSGPITRRTEQAEKPLEEFYVTFFVTKYKDKKLWHKDC